MTRVLVQRGSSSGGSSSNPNRNGAGGGSSCSSNSRAEPPQVVVSPENGVSEEVIVGSISEEVLETGDKGKSEEVLIEQDGDDSVIDDDVAAAAVVESDVREEIVKGLRIGERVVSESEDSSGDCSSQLPVGSGGGSSCPPPPPVPPPKPSVVGNLNSRRSVAGSLNSGSVGSSRRTVAAWPGVSARTSPAGSRPSSPRSHNESEGYNSADEQKPCLVSSYDDFVS